MFFGNEEVRRNQLSTQLVILMEQLRWKIKGSFSRSNEVEVSKYIQTISENEVEEEVEQRTSLTMNEIIVNINYTSWHRLYINTSSIELQIARRQRHIFHRLWYRRERIPSQAGSDKLRNDILHFYSFKFSCFLPSAQVDTFQPLFALRKNLYKWFFGFTAFILFSWCLLSSRSFVSVVKEILFLSFITECRSILEFVNNEKWHGFSSL